LYAVVVVLINPPPPLPPTPQAPTKVGKSFIACSYTVMAQKGGPKVGWVVTGSMKMEKAGGNGDDSAKGDRVVCMLLTLCLSLYRHHPKCAFHRCTKHSQPDNVARQQLSFHGSWPCLAPL
jgi:hypothetical protein